MKRFTPRTITGIAALTRKLGRVRRDGFAMDREEYLADVICVAAAIRDHTGAVVDRSARRRRRCGPTEAHLRLIRNEVMAAAGELSAELARPAV